MQSPRTPWKGRLLCGAALGQASGGRAAPPWSDSAPQRPPLATPALRSGPANGEPTEREGGVGTAPQSIASLNSYPHERGPGRDPKLT